jgi:Fe-S cluster assembly protein SufD
MTEKRVITRSRAVKRSQVGDFAFSLVDIPALNDQTSYAKYVKEYYQDAWNSNQSLKLPGVTDEAWRRTDLRGFNPVKFHLPEELGISENVKGVPSNLLHPMVDDNHAGQIVLSPSGVYHEIERDSVDNGIIFTDLATSWTEYPEILERILGKIIRPEEGKFAALAGSFARNGILVYIPPGVHLEKPLQSIFWLEGKGLAHFDHILVYVDDNASLTYVHEISSPGVSEGDLMRSGIVEVFVGQNSKLKFVELQTLGTNVWNFSHERVKVERDGHLDWIFGAIGSRLTKSFMDLDLAGEGATGRLSGFYFTDGVQHLDHDTQQNHLALNTTSDLLFKGALKDQSRSVWQGMIYVAPGAQKTDGYQANRNLILSSKARADSIPGLEILADDVRCTHGATAGKIDQEQVFYLLSRGIPYEIAEMLVVEGFFEDVMQRIPFDGIKARFKDAIIEKMG